MIQPNSTPQPEGPYQPNSSLIPVQKDVSAEYYLKLGKNLYHSYLARSRQQDLNNAIQHFQKALEIEPGLAEAYVQLASALWDQGTINLELAQFYCETALKLDPAQAEAHLFLGYFLQRAGFLEDARQQYQFAIRKDFWHAARPRIALGSTLLKQSLQAMQKWQQLGLAYQGIFQFLLGCLLLPWDRQTCRLLQEAFLTDAQIYVINFLAAGFKKLNCHAGTQKTFLCGIRLLPSEPIFYHLLGDHYFYEQNQPEAAITYYKQAYALDTNNLGLLKKLGKAYALIHEHNKAAEVLHNAIDKDPNDFDSLYQLGQLYTEQKAYMKALYYFKETAAHKMHCPYVHSNMAYVLFKMDDIDGAFEEYKVALEYGTDSAWLSTVSQTLGTMAYQVYQDTKQALTYFEQSLHFNPENMDTLTTLADLYFEVGQLDNALMTYKTILQVDPYNADCYSNIGYILWQIDRNEEAIDAYLAAIHHDPDNAIAHNNLGVIYLDEQNNPQKALALFQTALKLKPAYTLACFNVGRALKAMGNTLEAAEMFSLALQLNDQNPELDPAEIQSYLARLFD